MCKSYKYESFKQQLFKENNLMAIFLIIEGLNEAVVVNLKNVFQLLRYSIVVLLNNIFSSF